MTVNDTPHNSTTVFPVFASKESFLTALREMADSGQREAILHEVLYRISNTDTSTWADPTARSDD